MICRGQSVQQRHGDIHHHDIRQELFGEVDGLAAGVRFRHHFDVGFRRQQCPETLANHVVIINQQDFDFKDKLLC